MLLKISKLAKIIARQFGSDNFLIFFYSVIYSNFMACFMLKILVKNFVRFDKIVNFFVLKVKKQNFKITFLIPWKILNILFEKSFSVDFFFVQKIKLKFEFWNLKFCPLGVNSTKNTFHQTDVIVISGHPVVKIQNFYAIW